MTRQCPTTQADSTAGAPHERLLLGWDSDIPDKLPLAWATRPHAAGRLSWLHNESARPTTIRATSARFTKTPGGVAVLTMGITRKISLLLRCSSRSTANRKGTKARYRTRTTIHSKQRMSWHSPQAA